MSDIEHPSRRLMRQGRATGHGQFGQTALLTGSGTVTLGPQTVYVGPDFFLSDGRARLLSWSTATEKWWLGSISRDALEWMEVGRTPFFVGSRLPGIWTGVFGGNQYSSVLMYDAYLKDWWLGWFPNGTELPMAWRKVDNTSNYGDLLDGQHLLLAGHFDNAFYETIVFNYVRDGNWFLENLFYPYTEMIWNPIGNTGGFGNLLDGRHLIRQGYFIPDPRGYNPRTRIVIYHGRDGNWWLLGVETGRQPNLTVTGSGNTSGFGDLTDGRHLLFVGNFGEPETDVLLMNYDGDGNWFLGTFADDGSLAWTPPIGNTAGFGNLADDQHAFWVGSFGRQVGNAGEDLLMYSGSDGGWWRARYQFFPAGLGWELLDNTKAVFGNLLDGEHLLFEGAFLQRDEDHILFHHPPDGNWFFGYVTPGEQTIEWSLMQETQSQP